MKNKLTGIGMVIALGLFSLVACMEEPSEVDTSTQVVQEEQQVEELPMGEEVNLSSGSYTAGSDFKIGKYDIVITEGTGNVFCLDNGLNLCMDVKGENGFITDYKNAKFSEGELLEVGGCKIKLIPKE